MPHDAKALREQLEAITGERISALEGVRKMSPEATSRTAEIQLENEREPRRGIEPNAAKERSRSELDRDRETGISLGL